jgi:hypothetical protein
MKDIVPRRKSLGILVDQNPPLIIGDHQIIIGGRLLLCIKEKDHPIKDGDRNLLLMIKGGDLLWKKDVGHHLL